MTIAPHYDVAIIGAGMSGLAAGIRLAHFGKRVCIFERHNVVGGLNSFYSIAGRKYDVGLHAMTNYVPPGVRGTPLGKLLRQLRIDRDEFALCPQKRSRIAFAPGGPDGGQVSLAFTNDFAVFESEVARAFPAQIDGFRRLVGVVKTYDDVSLGAQPESARAVVRRHVTDPLLEDMLFCPVMYYGSAQERDMEFGQFVIMFKALFLEGFARPFDGVRVILRVLLEKYRAAGGERRMKCGVRRIVSRAGRAAALVLDNGEEVTATHIISTIGAPETEALVAGGSPGPESEISNPESRMADAVAKPSHPPGRLSYCETITVLDRQPAALGWGDDTIVFFNDGNRFAYERPADLVDTRSGVICFPNNFEFGADPATGAPRQLADGWLRCTCLANHDRWAALAAADPAGRQGTAYREAKRVWFAAMQASALRFLPPPRLTARAAAGSAANAAAHDDAGVLAAATVATDMFTPLTIVRYTGHAQGAIYGSPRKLRDGRTALGNVYLAGTDQGFLGIVGAMLSGISMANFHVLQARA
ncbi:phytoene dehydrogenase [Opitutaceae bacterium TAV5]|nr:phytoene dehydrogenase [Opitutaceae bacterium TAV5]